MFSFLDALLADLQNSSRSSGKSKPADDFPPPPSGIKIEAFAKSPTAKAPPPKTMPKPSKEISQPKPDNNNTQAENLSQKSFNNLSELEGLLQDLDRASDNYHRKSFAQNIAHTPTAQATKEGITSIALKCTSLTKLIHLIKTHEKKYILMITEGLISWLKFITKIQHNFIFPQNQKKIRKM